MLKPLDEYRAEAPPPEEPKNSVGLAKKDKLRTHKPTSNARARSA
jgi:hypothetical protein